MSKVPLHVLPGFVAAARHRNLTRAAASLHLTVSALSHQVRGLESLLERRLFDRGPRGLTLTPAGERLLAAVGPAFDALSAALTPDRPRRPTVLTLSVMPSFATSWLVPRLGAFVAAHPEIELNLESESRLVEFDREDVDAAIRFGAGHWPTLRIHHLFDEWIVPVASPALLARHPGVDPANLASLPLLGDPGGRWRDWFARFGGMIPERFVAGFDDPETLHRAAVEGVGVALGRLTMVRPFLDSGRLVALTGQRLPAESQHYLVYPARSEHHLALVAFRTWLLGAVAEEATRTRRPAPTPPPRRRSRRR